jgi:hypothetical protein
MTPAPALFAPMAHANLSMVGAAFVSATKALRCEMVPVLCWNRAIFNHASMFPHQRAVQTQWTKLTTMQCFNAPATQVSVFD